MTSPISDTFDTDIAVVGMAGRFPGARNTAEFWRNLREGVESVVAFTDEQLLAAGVDPKDLADPNYVKAGAVLPDMEGFDAPFFGFSPREASVMDPQHRHFLECAWEALEDAGHVPARFDGSIGVFGGSGHNAYMPYNLLTNPKLMASMGFFLVRHTGNDKDFLTTRVSYLLDLKGPSVNVQTACSTSLVAMHMGVQSLLARECDMALAGGVTIELPHRHGYLYREGEILSPDGHCRSFDAQSEGTVFGSGVGIVVLRRLADALADGDHIHCVIKGSAINNDGSGKVGYLAPSVDGQAQAIAEALAIANVSADTIGYVEAHGTGTPVGDPIEIAALTQAFRQSTELTGYCGIGSVKSNIGHTDTAAGVASFIKVAKALQHRELPPSLHFGAPNPACEFEGSPFAVNATLKPWVARPGVPRRAGVSSLGVGGTNAHIVVEEAPARDASGAARAHQLLLLSAKTAGALDRATAALGEHLQDHSEIAFADAAYTLQIGRQPMKQRRVLVARDAADAAAALSANDAQRLYTHAGSEQPRGVAFMFAGGGAQYPNMGADLYRSEVVFRDTVDECLTLLARHSPLDFRAALMPPAGQEAAAATLLEKPALALPALFTVQLAQAKLWMSWGLEPAAMIGHSMGEYTAAHLAGVFSLDDALALVALRGRLFESLPEGGMLSVPMATDELQALMPADLSIAAVNGPQLCVASGPVRSIDALQQQLEARDVDAARVRISVAAHSSMLEPILADFGAFFRGIRMNSPQRPFVSNLSGTWITPAEATDPAYWVRHLRQTVQFAQGLSLLLSEDGHVLLEVGPGRTLASLARQHPGRPAAQPVFNSLRHPDEQVHDQAFVLGVLGKLWVHGAEVDWKAFHGDAARHRVPLPTYPFEHQRHWVEPGKSLVAEATAAEPTLERRHDVADWFYRPQWRRAELQAAAPAPAGRALVFEDELGFGARLAALLRAAGRDVVSVRVGAAFANVAADAFTVRAGHADDHAALIGALKAADRLPQDIVHAWSLTGAAPADATDVDAALAAQTSGFYSLLALAQALGSEDVAEPLNLVVLTDHVQRVAGEDAQQPAKATVLGACRVLPREFPNLRARAVDVVLPPTRAWLFDRLVANVAAELAATDAAETLAWRGGERWVLEHTPARLDAPAVPVQRLRPHGVYLITGGLGGVGLAMAEHLASRCQARLVLLGRTALPPREQWSTLLAQPDSGAVAQRIRQVRALEAQGAEVMLTAADVTNLAQMRAVVREATERFGTIHGVLHTAGVIDDGVVQLKDAAAAAAVLAPKLQGTLVLEAALAGTALDFTVLFSSVSSFSGLAGQVDYAAANAFLDAYAHARCARDGCFTVAVNWSAWAEVGMAAAMGRQLGIAGGTEPAFDGGSAVGHPLIERCLRQTADERLYATRFSTASHWLLDEHRVRGGEALIPGTGYLDLLRAAYAHGRSGDAPIELRDVTFLAPFVVRAGEARELRVQLKRAGSNAWRFAVRSESADGWVDHVRGQIADAAPTPSALAAPGPVIDRCRMRTQTFDGSERPVHLQFGARWGNVQRIHFGAHEAVAQLELPAAFHADLAQFALHPALMDMATGGAQALVPGYDEREDFFVPASYGRVTVRRPLVPQIFSHVRYRADESSGKDLATYDVTITDADGTVLVEVAEFSMIRVRDKALLAAPAANAAPAAAAEPARAQATANHVLELGLRDGIRNDEGAEVLTRVLAAGAVPQIVVSPQDLGAMVAKLREPANAAPAAGAPAAAAPARDVSVLEAALRSHKAVREAAASAHGERIVAYVVYDPDHSITVSELRRHVRAAVPDDLVPQTFVELDALPRTAGGELDRAALPSPFAEERAAVAPRTPTEQAIGTLWQELLGAASVGVHDNFFDIGGHSLLSVRFISRLHKKLGVRLLHEHVVVNTLEQLAVKCDQLLGSAAPAAPAPATVPDAASANPAPAAPKGLFSAVRKAVLGNR